MVCGLGPVRMKLLDDYENAAPVTTLLVASGWSVGCRRVVLGEDFVDELTAARHADLLEDGLDVVTDGVSGEVHVRCASPRAGQWGAGA
jgi:hypothetical protein